jgi:nitroimidazol reductase NimA-like FMN-containing flavoprotein (pyridoxamine 5'-phosphate oxidase superfamily)
MADSELATSAERRDFVHGNHTCVIGYGRKSAGPSMSIVHYVMDGDKIVFLTMAERQKAKAVTRGVKLSVCILDGDQGGLSWPPEYLVVDGESEIITDMDYVVKTAMGVGSVMTGKPVPPEAEPMVREMMVKEGRVAICLTPESSFHSASVHPEEGKEMVHGLGSRLPWFD